MKTKSILKYLLSSLVVAVVATACGDKPVTSSFEGTPDQQRAILLERPSIEEASARHQEMLTRIRDELAVQFGWIRWEQTKNLTRAGCTEFPAYSNDTETHSVGNWKAVGNISDADWLRAVQLADRIAGSYGFEPSRPLADRPGDHEVVAFDKFGNTYSFGTLNNTVLSGSTGCHLFQAAKDRIAAPGQ